MDGVFLGFQIAAGISLFALLFFVVIPRLWMPFLAWWYLRVDKTKTPPPKVRRYLMKRGIQRLTKAQGLPPEVQQKVAMEELIAALDDPDGVFDGMWSEMSADAMTRLAQIPLEHCASCNRPVFTHQATKIDAAYYCESCGQGRKAT